MFLRNEYHVQLTDKLLQTHYEVACTYAVMVAGSGVLETIYALANDSTAASNPGAGDSGGEIHFFTAATTTSVDITIYTANGEAVYIKGLTPSVHHVEIDRQKMEQMLVVPLVYNDNTETTTGFTIVGGTLIRDVMLYVETIDATETIDVGLDGTTTDDADGLIDGASIATAGWVALQGAVNNGSNIDYTDSVLYGVLMASFINGSDAVVTCGGVIKKSTLIGSAETDANITTTCSAGSDTFIGFLVLDLVKLPY